MRKNKYIHIGFAKSASTSLQRDFFSEHPQLFHLGIGLKEGKLDYYSEEIKLALEVDIRCKKDLIYSSTYVKDIFQKFFELADKDTKVRLTGISFEGLSFTFINDVDITQKAQRLYNIFGKNSKIIILIREQISFIKSFYGECVRSGYYGSFQRFLNDSYAFQFRTFITDLKYYDIYRLYCTLFGEENIFIVPYESLQQDALSFQKRLCDFLEIEDYHLELKQHNISTCPYTTNCIRMLNYFYRNNLGNSFYQNAYGHRFISYFCNELNIDPPKKALSDFKTMRKTHRIAKKLAKLRILSPVDYSIDEEYEKLLRQMFAEQNRRLSDEANVGFESYGYML